MTSRQQSVKNTNRRDARKAAQAKNADKAVSETMSISEQMQRNGQKSTAGPYEKTSRPAITKRNQLKEKHAAMAAEQDRTLRKVPLEVDLKDYRHTLDNPPLNVLNELAKKARKTQLDHARSIAKAAGKAAFDIATGRRPPAQRDRHAKVAQAQRDMAAAQEKKKAAEAKDAEAKA